MEENDELNKIKEEKFKKILLMGKAGVGKTSIKSVIFEYKSPKDTLELDNTNEIEVSHIKFMNNVFIKLLDCCGKEEYLTQYLGPKKNFVFSNVDILIYVTEVNKKRDFDDIEYFEK